MTINYKEPKELGSHSEIFFKSIPITNSRVKFLPEYCKGKNVLSIGCVDMIHSVPLDQIIKMGNHQFYNLEKTCKSLVGIDINQEGINQLNEKGFEVYKYDIFKDKNENLENRKYDVVVVSHVIEHVPDLYGFLNKIINKFSFDEIIVAVPNSYHFYNIINMCVKNKEVVSNDHYYTFSPITLIKLMENLGLDLKELYFDREREPRFKPKNFILNKLYTFTYKNVLNRNGNLIYIGKQRSI